MVGHSLSGSCKSDDAFTLFRSGEKCLKLGGDAYIKASLTCYTMIFLRLFFYVVHIYSMPALICMFTVT
jgi:hypothetical protein